MIIWVGLEKSNDSEALSHFKRTGRDSIPRLVVDEERFSGNNLSSSHNYSLSHSEYDFWWNKHCQTWDTLAVFCNRSYCSIFFYYCPTVIS